MKLHEYVRHHVVRGACQCGRCIDAPSNPEQKQPDGHTADLVFFKIATRNSPSKDDFENLVKAEFPQWLDGNEHNYLEIGADIGDQGLGMMTMGLGSLLGTWTLLTPAMLPGLTEDLIMQMAGMGAITVQVFPDATQEKPNGES